VHAAAAQLGDSGKVGVVGYCWGGTVAFLANTRLSMPAVSYYGARTVPFLDERLDAPMMFHFGERDASIPASDIALHRDHHPQAEVHVYPAGHGFNCDQRADYEPRSASLALERTLGFFRRTLRPAY
jgi:carboxymethylenebutenolidase